MNAFRKDHRTILPKIAVSGQRQVQYRLITSVDLDSTDSTALTGHQMPSGRQVDLPVGGILTSATPSGSAKNHSFDWRYALIPPQGEPLDWSQPNPDTRFLDFRDAVAAELFQSPPQTTATPFSFPTTPGPRPQPSRVVTNANNMYISISAALKDPGITAMSYSWPNGGFITEGTPAITARVLLQEASTFMAWAIHPCPALVAPNLSWKNNSLNLTINGDTVFESSQGVHPERLRSLTEAPRLARNINLVLNQIYGTIPDLTREAWQSVKTALELHGFTIHDTTGQSVKLLLPQGGSPEKE